MGSLCGSSVGADDGADVGSRIGAGVGAKGVLDWDDLVGRVTPRTIAAMTEIAKIQSRYTCGVSCFLLHTRQQPLPR